MDPLANIERQRVIAQRLTMIANAPSPEGQSTATLVVEAAHIAFELAELVLGLDEWRSNDGFDPYADAVDDHREVFVHLLYTEEDVRGMIEDTEGTPIDENLAMDRAREWGKHIEATAATLISGQLHDAVVTGDVL